MPSQNKVHNPLPAINLMRARSLYFSEGCMFHTEIKNSVCYFSISWNLLANSIQRLLH